MTFGPPLNEDCYIPPVPAGTPPPKDPNNTFWIIIAVLFIGVMFIVPLLFIVGFEYGVLGNVEHAWVVSATANQPDPHTIIVTYLGGQDAGSLTGMTVTVTDSNGQTQTKSIGSET